MPYLSALEVCSRRGATQIHVNLIYPLCSILRFYFTPHSALKFMNSPPWTLTRNFVPRFTLASISFLFFHPFPLPFLLPFHFTLPFLMSRSGPLKSSYMGFGERCKLFSTEAFGVGTRLMAENSFCLCWTKAETWSKCVFVSLSDSFSKFYYGGVLTFTTSLVAALFAPVFGR